MSAAAPCGDKPAAAQHVEHHPRALLEPRHPPPAEALNAEGAVDVTVRTHVMSLSSIDSHEQRFEALVWLQLEWFVRLPVDAPAATAWRPELTILNLSRSGGGADKPPAFRAVAEAAGTRCFLAYSVHGEFMHRFQLRSFPFDTQVLAVHGVLWRSPLERALPRGGAPAPAASGEDGDDGDDGGDALDVDGSVSGSDVDEADLECTPFRGRLAFRMGRHILYRDGFVQQDVWCAPRRNAVAVRAGHTDERHRGAADGQRFSTLTIEICVKRRHHFYLLNIVLPFNLFVCLSLISFAVDIPGVLSDRTTITLNMVLTAAAFKVVVSNYTPAVAYLTVLDAYLLLCFLFLSTVAAANVAISMAPDDARARSWNHNIGVSLAVAWAGVHVALPLAKRAARLQHRTAVRARDAREQANVRRWAGLERSRSARASRTPLHAPDEEAHVMLPEPRRLSLGAAPRHRGAAPGSPGR